MPNTIVRLDENSIRQIAAGEVVERPASIVKELLENAIDAGSRKLTLEIEDGGKRMIRLSDDGCGMDPEDARLSLERHTTSKIRSSDDLFSLATFGFRGEALPSIASVSKLKLTTRAFDGDSGVSIRVEDGRTLPSEDCARAPGTTVEVKDLFFNVPARLKFLKSETAEKSRILKTFEETAAAHPDIAFELVSDGKKSGEYPSRKESIQRIRDLWGDSFSSGTMAALQFEHPYLKITGWVSKPEAHQATKSTQLFYVNRRPIVSRLLSHALYEAYRDCLPVGRHPAAVIFLDLDPSSVDVNVHPSKREVRFKNESQIYESLLREVRARRTDASTPPSIFFADASAPRAVPSPIFERPVRYASSAVTEEFRVTSQAPSSEKTVRTAPMGEGPRILAQFQSLYVIAEKGDSLLIVDQHAAEERVLYEKFRTSILSKPEAPTQTLLFPVVWNVTPSQNQMIASVLPDLKKLGFMLEPFGEKTFRISEAPAAVPHRELQGILDEILKTIENDRMPTLAVEEKIMRAACRAAVKANDRLSNEALSNLLLELERCSNPHTCPHGRPVAMVITRGELDKKFGRIH